MTKTSGAPGTPARIVNFGLIILTRAMIYSSNIMEWYDKPEAKKTWPNFKLHFKVAQKPTKKSQPVNTTN